MSATTTDRPGTRATVRYLRVSPSKARAVLDLIRGEHVGAATDLLELTDRAVSRDIAKLLQSAIANAEHNDSISADELVISACWADEGPTLKRWRPRARGRATPIHKRTCHITIVVSRMTADELERHRAQESSRGRQAGRSAAESRRRRVERSRKRAEEAGDHDHDHDHDEDVEATADATDEATTDASDAPVDDTDAADEDAADDDTPDQPGDEETAATAEADDGADAADDDADEEEQA